MDPSVWRSGAETMSTNGPLRGAFPGHGRCLPDVRDGGLRHATRWKKPVQPVCVSSALAGTRWRRTKPREGAGG
jgi:hypothetical protein